MVGPITFELFSATKADLVQTHSDVESVKNKLNDLVASFAGLNSTVDNIKKDMNGKFSN